MKKYPFLALVFLSLLLVGSTFGLEVGNPTEQDPACLSPSFWGFMYGIPAHSVPGGQVIIPPLAGVTVELWFGGNRIATYRTSSCGKYCLLIAPAYEGEYIIKMPGCFERHVFWRPSDGSVRIDFKGVMCVSGPQTPVPGPPQSGAPAQPE